MNRKPVIRKPLKTAIQPAHPSPPPPMKLVDELALITSQAIANRERKDRDTAEAWMNATGIPTMKKAAEEGRRSARFTLADGYSVNNIEKYVTNAKLGLKTISSISSQTITFEW